MRLGEYDPVQDAGPDTQRICDQIRPIIEAMDRTVYSEFKATQFREQVVSGLLTLIKVCVGGGDFFHVCIYKVPECDGGRLRLEGVQRGKKNEDPLEAFTPKTGI